MHKKPLREEEISAICQNAGVPSCIRVPPLEVAATRGSRSVVARRIAATIGTATGDRGIHARIGGEEFAAVTMRADQVLLDEPAVIAPCTGGPPEGSRVTVRLETADVASRKVSFAYEKALA